ECKRLDEKYKKELDHWLKKQSKEVAEAFLLQQSKKRTKRLKSGDEPITKKLKESSPMHLEEASSSDDSDDDSSSSDDSDDDSSSDSSDSDSDASSSD
uniref:Uncharacterized protein n=1 Tax=Ciona savignyi TaxID=51511 RepID=H2YNF0_CIOSA